ncbi:MAG: hypothetical protein HZC43_10135 [Nitrosomonadales bacterium]|nr:hypothetical protein [Nitrosomonadales bacterium]
MLEFFPGEVARLTNVITDSTGAAVDPGAVRVKVKGPDGVVATYSYPATVTKSGVGLYACDVPLPTAGAYRWRWESDAPNAGAAQGNFLVLPGNV